MTACWPHCVFCFFIGCDSCQYTEWRSVFLCNSQNWMPLVQGGTLAREFIYNIGVDI